MKNRPFVLTLLFILIAGHTALAETVYLKNGRSLTGSIVEKNSKYLVIKTGEGEAMVKTTIFLDDINRIEEGGQALENLSTTPFKFLNTDPFFTAPTDNNSVERIKDLLEENKQVQIPDLQETSTPMNITEGSFPAGPQSKYGKPGLFVPPGSLQGTASISGFVTLPQAPGKGDLYIYLTEKTETGQYALATWIPYIKIPSLDVTARQVGYKMDNIPVGTYQVFAQWHVASSVIPEQGITQTQGWEFIGIKGDSTGRFETPVVLGQDEERTGINIACSTLIKTGIVSSASTAKNNIQVGDIYYQMLLPKPPKFIMVVKNAGDKLVTPVRLIVLINDDKLSQSSVYLRDLAAGKETEIEVTSIYDTYMRYIERKNKTVAESFKTVKFKVTQSDTGEVKFEKTLFIS